MKGACCDVNVRAHIVLTKARGSGDCMSFSPPLLAILTMVYFVCKLSDRQQEIARSDGCEFEHAGKVG